MSRFLLLFLQQETSKYRFPMKGKDWVAFVNKEKDKVRLQEGKVPLVPVVKSSHGSHSLLFQICKRKCLFTGGGVQATLSRLSDFILGDLETL